MATLQHLTQWQIAQTTDGRVRNVGPQRSAWINVFENIIDRVYNTHFVPDSYSHRRAFFRIDRAASKVFLIQPCIDFVNTAEEWDKGSLGPQPKPQKMQTWLRNHAQYPAKEHVDLTASFHDHGIKANCRQ